MVEVNGIEPSFHGLKDRCSAIELHFHFLFSN
jgi:hypothetical protein